MGLLDFFSSNHQKKYKEYLKQLLLIGLADGSLDTLEKSYIESIAQRLNISKQEVEELSRDFDPEKIKYKLPGDADEKFFLLFNLINIIRADGDTHPQEILVTENIVMKLGYAPDTVGIILETLEHNNSRNISDEETYQHLKTMLH